MESLVLTRREEEQQQKLLSKRKTLMAAGHAAGISIKTMELMLSVLKQYAGTMTKSELIRVVVEQIGRLI